MLTFNDLLPLEGVDPAQVRLARHQDRRLARGRLYEAWRNDRAAFEAYQSVQVRDVFPVDELSGELRGHRGPQDGVRRDLPGRRRRPLPARHPRCPARQRRLRPVQLRPAAARALADYRDKLVIDWGAGTRTWVQRAANQPKPVIEIAEQYEPRFPGFREFVRPVDDVPTLPNGWQQVLRSVKGVYLLVDVESGQQYVGSAKGADSLLGRWMEYATDGHGGNLGLKERQPRRADGPTRCPCSRWSTRTPLTRRSSRSSPTGSPSCSVGSSGSTSAEVRAATLALRLDAVSRIRP